MKELQTVLNNILTDKNTNLKPENLKKDVICLGVTGTLETSTTSGGVKQFSTVEEMNSSTGNTEGDLAIVYSLNIRNIQQGETITNTLLFPDTVTFDTTVDAEFGIYGDLTIDNDALEFTLTSDKCYISSVGSEFCRIIYDSTNGKIYTKTSSTVSGISVTNLTVPELDEHLYSFVQIAIASFNGIYKYNGTSWELAPTDLTTAADEVYLTKFYGKNGVTTGTLTANVSNSFADTNAEIYNKIQQAYNNMTPRVLTDTDKTIDTNIYFIPTNSDNEVLLDTSAVTDASNMFKYCRNLTTIPLLNTSNVTNMKEMFNGCNNLTTIPLLNTSNVTNMRDMFISCSNLTTVPLLDTSKVTDMVDMFVGCASLTTIPLLDTNAVTNMQSMFRVCNNLTNIPLLNTNKVTSMKEMFSQCSNLIEVPLLDTSKVTNMHSMFISCTSLTTVPLLSTNVVTDMNYMFNNCPNLSDDSLNNILAMCANATKMTLGISLKAIGLTSAQATKCKTLSNYSAFTAAGWTTGY